MHVIIHGQDVNLPMNGPGILDKGPVKAVSKMRQSRRMSSATTAEINKVARLYMMNSRLGLIRTKS